MDRSVQSTFPFVKPSQADYTEQLISVGLTEKGERFKALPYVVRYGYFQLRLTKLRSLSTFVIKWLREKHNGYAGRFLAGFKKCVRIVENLCFSHINWVKGKVKALDPRVKIRLEELSAVACKKVIEIRGSKYKLRGSSADKLHEILFKVLEYIYRYGKMGNNEFYVDLPKNMFLKFGAYDGGKSGPLHYMIIREALSSIGILLSRNLVTFKTGPCQRYDVDFSTLGKRYDDIEMILSLENFPDLNFITDDMHLLGAK